MLGQREPTIFIVHINASSTTVGSLVYYPNLISKKYRVEEIHDGECECLSL